MKIIIVPLLDNPLLYPEILRQVATLLENPNAADECLMDGSVGIKGKDGHQIAYVEFEGEE
jgi:hypothetical protein